MKLAVGLHGWLVGGGKGRSGRSMFRLHLMSVVVVVMCINFSSFPSVVGESFCLYTGV